MEIEPIKPYYSDDNLTIYNADCRKVLPFLKRFDLLLTDPPYKKDFPCFRDWPTSPRLFFFWLAP